MSGEPTALLAAERPHQIWGDPAAGQVVDHLYVSNEKVHLLVFEMPPGASFKHSAEVKTIFDSDQLHYVLSGVLAMTNPETGEVHRALPGEAVFFRRDTWHHGFSVGMDSLRILECIAP